MRIEHAQPHHTRLIAASMRERDIAEIRDGWSKEPIEAMAAALAASYYARTMFYDLEPLCMYGLAPLCVLTGHARLWIFAASAIDRHPIAFARASRRGLPGLFEHCSALTNLIAVDDAPAWRWMRWLGGHCVSPNQVCGGRLFAQFIVTDPHKEVLACRLG